MLTSYQQQQIHKMSHLIAYSGVHFCLTFIMTVVLFPISKEVIAPILSFIVPLSHPSLTKTLLVVSAMYWLPVFYRCLRIALRKEEVLVGSSQLHLQ
jgi:uncharacterized membrane protein